MSGKEREDTYPPCIACHAHDGLEKKFSDMKSHNYKEHKTLTDAILKMTVSQGWIIKIMSALLTVIGVVFLMVWSLHSDKNEEQKAIIKMGTTMEHISTTLEKHDRSISDCKERIYMKKEFYEKGVNSE